jgi:hypothetical protein
VFVNSCKINALCVVCFFVSVCCDNGVSVCFVRVILVNDGVIE